MESADGSAYQRWSEVPANPSGGSMGPSLDFRMGPNRYGMVPPRNTRDTAPLYDRGIHLQGEPLQAMGETAASGAAEPPPSPETDPADEKLDQLKDRIRTSGNWERIPLDELTEGVGTDKYEQAVLRQNEARRLEHGPDVDARIAEIKDTVARIRQDPRATSGYVREFQSRTGETVRRYVVEHSATDRSGATFAESAEYSEGGKLAIQRTPKFTYDGQTVNAYVDPGPESLQEQMLYSSPDELRIAAAAAKSIRAALRDAETATGGPQDQGNEDRQAEQPQIPATGGDIPATPITGHTPPDEISKSPAEEPARPRLYAAPAEAIAEQRPHRIPGELERADPTIEPLPPTPITNEAQELLREWGLSDEHIRRLQEHVSSMRYDLAPQKAERIVRNGGYILEPAADYPAGGARPHERLFLPDFGSFEGRGDGACGTLTIQLGRQLYTTGYLEEVNAHAREQGKPELRPVYINGQSRTHFVRPHDNHAWYGLTSGEEDSPIVTVDASFQEISAGVNGYHIKKVRADIPGDLPATASLGVGTYIEDTRGFGVMGASTLILGSSFDQKLVYGLSASKEPRAGTYHLDLFALLPDGGERGGYIIGKQGVIRQFTGKPGDAAIITPAHHREMRGIINTLSKMPISRDQIRAREYSSMRHPPLSFYR